MSGNKRGIVYIVGAGPGDPGLLTLKALEAMKNADVILYDRLVSDDILRLVDVEKIYVGRSVGDDYRHQEKTNMLMLKYAKEGKKVVRLKGGDPFIFGRGGEEAEFLKENGIEFKIVPGISSAVGSPAYAGIPLTHREFSSSLAIVTGHEDLKKRESRVRWRDLARAVDTIVILMGMDRLAFIIDELREGGIDPEIEVAIIENGTTEKQRVLTGRINNIVKLVKEKRMKAPAVIVIGRVAAFAGRSHA